MAERTIKDMNELPQEMREFVEAIRSNACKVWDAIEDRVFLESLLFIKELRDGSIQVCDNYERFFDIIYRRNPDGQWFVRSMYSGIPERAYSFSSAMSDAGIMYTG